MLSRGGGIYRGNGLRLMRRHHMLPLPDRRDMLSLSGHCGPVGHAILTVGGIWRRRIDPEIRFESGPNILLGWRWCSETHTFIMHCGQCMITLEDVTMQLGLQVNGDVVTGRSKVLEPSVTCHRLLRWSPVDGEENFTCLTLPWLIANFQKLSSIATEYEVRCVARAYIMQLI
ncbi:hypothetical protein PVK06_019709 [Gossypium arboreum]|uniref:Aminotransferase-like plant mobile domain-containing protein n=1 Tax=Gossypium arboreum TaxID=29729 RepID=A0ABR0PKS8_GOSAR|nr:hypothetical protein PVK06_019709 [Gossypium arboreum]